jgi:hypothetical protein
VPTVINVNLCAFVGFLFIDSDKCISTKTLIEAGQN